MSKDWNTYDTSTHTDEAFADWLNRIDATIGYDKRRTVSLAEWNQLFQFGYSSFEAVQAWDEMMG